jgi:hypothetical protein
MSLAQRVLRRFLAKEGHAPSPEPPTTAQKVAARFLQAMEFSTPEAMKEYLHEHPQADPSNHWVKTKDEAHGPKDNGGGSKEKSEEKEEAKGENGGSKEKPEVPKSKPLAKPKEKARVGVAGPEVPPPPAKLPRLPNLREDEKKYEERMNDAFEKNPDGAAKAFFESCEKNNWVFETDAAKNLLPEWSRPDLPKDEKTVHPERAEFRGKYNAVLHQAANAIAKRAFLSRLDDIAKMPEEKRKVLVTSGGVACHGRGTPILMYDGTIKPVEDVALGDRVMGPDSRPRTVQAVTQGLGPMYLVRPKRGVPFTANDQHVLSLKYPMRHQHSKTKIVNLTIEAVLSRGERFRKGAFLYRTGVQYPTRPVPLDPYFLGLWLGDGTSSAPHITSADPEIEVFLRSFVQKYPRLHLRKGSKKRNKSSTYALALSGSPIGKSPARNPLTMALEKLGVMNNKHIPEKYLVNSEEVRLAVLAGLLDADGYYDSKRIGFEFITRFPKLAETTAYLCRSLGFGVSMKVCRKKAQNGFEGTYYRFWIAGNDLHRIPTRIQRKQAEARPSMRTNGRTCRDVLHTGFTLEPLGVDNFYGFTLDGDGLYLLGDFTVTHNSGKGSALAAQPDLAKSVAATWDAAGEQNATENEWLLEECKKRGIRPTFLFVHADPKQSWPGVVERAKGIGRMVDAQLFADSYAVGAKNFADFHGKHKDEADFVFGVFQGRGKPAKITESMPEEALKLDVDDIYQFASKYIDEKKDDLPAYIYDGATIGRRAFKAESDKNASSYSELSFRVAARHIRGRLAMANAKMPPQDKKELERIRKLFEKGLSDAAKDPEKMNELRIKQDQLVKPWEDYVKGWKAPKKDKGEKDK